MGRRPTIGTGCANWYCTAARSSEQHASLGSALRLGHKNSVRHSLKHVLGHVPRHVLKHVLVSYVPEQV